MQTAPAQHFSPAAQLVPAGEQAPAQTDAGAHTAAVPLVRGEQHPLAHWSPRRHVGEQTFLSGVARSPAQIEPLQHSLRLFGSEQSAPYAMQAGASSPASWTPSPASAPLFVSLLLESSRVPLVCGDEHAVTAIAVSK